MDKTPMTAEGAEALRVELKRLTSTERPRIVKEISAALAQGDLRENAEFQYAKEEQGHIEGRISEIAAKLGAAQIINIKEIPKSGRIIFDDEADIKVNKISVYSPVARSLIGKQQDDVVLIQIPSGQIEYEILSVEHL